MYIVPKMSNGVYSNIIYVYGFFAVASTPPGPAWVSNPKGVIARLVLIQAYIKYVIFSYVVGFKSLSPSLYILMF